MPRATTSEASKILTYFVTTPLAEAKLLFDLVKDQIKLRLEEDAPPVRKPRKQRVPKTPPAAPPVNEATPLGEQPTVRKRAARKPKPAPAAEQQQLGDTPPAPGEYGG